MDAGFFRGTSADQDNRFANKQKKLLKSMKFADGLEVKVDMWKINMETVKPWISQKITQMLGFEDDVVIAYVYNSLEEERFPDPKVLQINLTGFLNGKNSRQFLGELWPLLTSAQENTTGIPEVLLEEKKEEIKKRQLEAEQIANLKVEQDKQRQENLLKFERKKRDKRRTKSRSRSRERHRRKYRTNRSRSRSHSPHMRNAPTSVKNQRQVSPKDVSKTDQINLKEKSFNKISPEKLQLGKATLSKENSEVNTSNSKKREIAASTPQYGSLTNDVVTQEQCISDGKASCKTESGKDGDIKQVSRHSTYHSSSPHTKYRHSRSRSFSPKHFRHGNNQTQSSNRSRSPYRYRYSRSPRSRHRTRSRSPYIQPVRHSRSPSYDNFSRKKHSERKRRLNYRAERKHGKKDYHKYNSDFSSCSSPSPKRRTKLEQDGKRIAEHIIKEKQVKNSKSRSRSKRRETSSSGSSYSSESNVVVHGKVPPDPWARAPRHGNAEQIATNQQPVGSNSDSEKYVHQGSASPEETKKKTKRNKLVLKKLKNMKKMKKKHKLKKEKHAHEQRKIKQKRNKSKREKSSSSSSSSTSDNEEENHQRHKVSKIGAAEICDSSSSSAHIKNSKNNMDTNSDSEIEMKESKKQKSKGKGTKGSTRIIQKKRKKDRKLRKSNRHLYRSSSSSSESESENSSVDLKEMYANKSMKVARKRSERSNSLSESAAFKYVSESTSSDNEKALRKMALASRKKK